MLAFQRLLIFDETAFADGSTQLYSDIGLERVLGGLKELSIQAVCTGLNGTLGNMTVHLESSSDGRSWTDHGNLVNANVSSRGVTSLQGTLASLQTGARVRLRVDMANNVAARVKIYASGRRSDVAVGDPDDKPGGCAGCKSGGGCSGTGLGTRGGTGTLGPQLDTHGGVKSGFEAKIFEDPPIQRLGCYGCPGSLKGDIDPTASPQCGCGFPIKNQGDCKLCKDSVEAMFDAKCAKCYVKDTKPYNDCVARKQETLKQVQTACDFQIAQQPKAGFEPSPSAPTDCYDPSCGDAAGAAWDACIKAGGGAACHGMWQQQACNCYWAQLACMNPGGMVNKDPALCPYTYQ